MLCGAVRAWKESQPHLRAPVLLTQISQLEQRIMLVYQLTTTGKFSDALNAARCVLQLALLIVVTKPDQSKLVIISITSSEIIGVARSTDIHCA